MSSVEVVSLTAGVSDPLMPPDGGVKPETGRGVGGAGSDTLCPDEPPDEPRDRRVDAEAVGGGSSACCTPGTGREPMADAHALFSAPAPWFGSSQCLIASLREASSNPSPVECPAEISRS